MKSLIKYMADRFCGWKLPQDFSPDNGIIFNRDTANVHGGWPTGTNLLASMQAEEMFRYCLDGAQEVTQQAAKAASTSEQQAVAWLATDLDGRGDVAFTKAEAKSRAGEGCTEFIALVEASTVVARALPKQLPDDVLRYAMDAVKMNNPDGARLVKAVYFAIRDALLHPVGLDEDATPAATVDAQADTQQAGAECEFPSFAGHGLCSTCEKVGQCMGSYNTPAATTASASEPKCAYCLTPGVVYTDENVPKPCPYCRAPAQQTERMQPSREADVTKPILRPVYMLWDRLREGGWVACNKNEYDAAKENDRWLLYELVLE